MSSEFMIASSIFFIGKASIVYGALAFSFSMIGLILPNSFVVGNPLEVSGISFEHVFGHIMWGLVAGIASFSFRYAILSGLFPIILDFDHLLQFFEVEMIPRMAHSFTFGLIVMVVMMVIFGKKDLRLAAISIAAVFSHLSFDIFLVGGTEFPVLAPFTSEFITFTEPYWILFQFISIALIFVASIIFFKKQKIKIMK